MASQAVWDGVRGALSLAKAARILEPLEVDINKAYKLNLLGWDPAAQTIVLPTNDQDVIEELFNYFAVKYPQIQFQVFDRNVRAFYVRYEVVK